MKNYDVQSIGLHIDATKAFQFISNPQNLPQWARAFKRADHKSALLETPQGQLEIKLEVKKDALAGTIDWYMTMPNGDVGKAFSRIVPNGKESIFAFFLLAPPVPLEHLEGALNEQMKILDSELKQLQTILR